MNSLSTPLSYPINLSCAQSVAHLPILAFETSCDDTAIALLYNNSFISKVQPQWDLVQQFRGISPKHASERHAQQLPLMYQQIVLDHEEYSNTPISDVKYLAVTRGPGLAPCLHQGVSFAENLSKSLNIPLISINHLEGHLLSPQIHNPEIQYPFLGCILSGGHSMVVYAKKLGDYSILCTTLDDAIGEVYDKVARILGIDKGSHGSYGAAVEAFAHLASVNDTIAPFTIPLLNQPQTSKFSFSGLKTQVLYKSLELGSIPKSQWKQVIQEGGIPLDKSVKAQICHRFQESSNFHIKNKIEILLKQYFKEWKKLDPLVEPPKSICLSGGVANNVSIRNTISSLCEQYNIDFYSAHPSVCMDNALMIAWAASQRLSVDTCDSFIYSPSDLLKNNDRSYVYYPSWPIGPFGPEIQLLSNRQLQKQHKSDTFNV